MAKSERQGEESGLQPGAGPRRGRWSRDDLERLRETYGLVKDELIARELGRSVASVRRMAQSLFSGSVRSGAWSDEDVAQLKRYLGATPISTLARVMRRTVQDVERKVAELAKTRRGSSWSHEEKAKFKRLYGTRTDEHMAAILSRDIESVRAMAKRLCLAKDKSFLRRQNRGEQTTRMPRWSTSELALLEKLYPSTSNLEIAQRLDRSVKSVVSKAHHMGLKKDVERLREMGRENVRLRYEERD